MQALINAHNYGKKYDHIGNNIIGIAFLGTPHRGADLAGVLTAVLTVSFSKRRFVNDLSSTSQTIEELNNLFRARAEQLELVSFWESTAMPVVGVRPRQLAILTIELGRGTQIISNIGLRSRRRGRIEWRSFYDCQISV